MERNIINMFIRKMLSLVIPAFTAKPLPVLAQKPVPVTLHEAEETISACRRNPNWTWHDLHDGGFLVNANRRVVLEYSFSEETGKVMYFAYCRKSAGNWQTRTATVDHFKAFAEHKFVAAA